MDEDDNLYVKEKGGINRWKMYFKGLLNTEIRSGIYNNIQPTSKSEKKKGNRTLPRLEWRKPKIQEQIKTNPYKLLGCNEHN